jgi:mRNA interferase HigB
VVRIISRGTLVDFWTEHRDAEAQLRAWFKIAKGADWRTPADVKAADPRASIIADDRVVFDIKGGAYRLVVAIKYRYAVIYIRFIGTHAEYDRIDATKI